MRTSLLAGLSWTLSGVISCGGGPSVARVANGHDIDGRFVSPEAYAAYLDGALLENQGDLKGAGSAYESALGEDSGAAEIWARLGRVRCSAAPAESDRAFEKARSRGKELTVVWLSDAECALERGEPERARTSAERAASLDPRNMAASFLVVAALARTGDAAGAERWLRATRLMYPEAASVPASLAEALAGGAAPRGGPRISRTAPAVLDDALRTGDTDGARRAAIEAHLGLATLALHAVELGQLGLARDSAALSLGGEPGNVDARVAALAVADLDHDNEALRRLATTLPRDHAAPSPLAVKLMTALLERRAGPGAARAFSEGFPEGRQGAPANVPVPVPVPVPDKRPISNTTVLPRTNKTLRRSPNDRSGVVRSGTSTGTGTGENRDAP